MHYFFLRNCTDKIVSLPLVKGSNCWFICLLFGNSQHFLIFFTKIKFIVGTSFSRKHDWQLSRLNSWFKIKFTTSSYLILRKLKNQKNYDLIVKLNVKKNGANTMWDFMTNYMTKTRIIDETKIYVNLLQIVLEIQEISIFFIISWNLDKRRNPKKISLSIFQWMIVLLRGEIS